MSDVIDLDAEKQKRKPGRPRKPKEEKAGAKPAGKAAPKGGNLPAIAPIGITVDPRGGVTINWLGDAFDLDPRTVKKRIQGRCRPIREEARAGGSPVLFYDLRDAARYLVEVPIAELIASATLKDMPPQLQAAFWMGQDLKLKVGKASDQVWDKEKVMALFARAFLVMKNQALTLPDLLERETGVDAAITRPFVDAFLNMTSEEVSFVVEKFDEMSYLAEVIDAEMDQAARAEEAAKEGGDDE